MHPARLVIVCGLPGALKTARAERLSERLAATRLRSDDWMAHLGIDLCDAAIRDRVEHLQSDLAIDLLRLGANVVIERRMYQRSERDAVRDRAIAVGALVHLDFIDAPVGTITHDDPRPSSESIEHPTDDELATYDPMPPVCPGKRPGSVSYPYGSWLPQSRPR